MKPTAKIMPLGESSNSFSKMRKLKLPPVTIVILILFAVTLIPIVIGLLKQSSISNRPKASNCLTNQCKLPSTGECVGIAYRYTSDDNVSHSCVGNDSWVPPLVSVTQAESVPAAADVVPTREYTKLSNKEIAAKVMEFLNSVKSPNGMYYIYNSSQANDPSLIDNRLATIVSWGRYNYWKMTNDSNIISQIEADLDASLNKSVVKTFQPDDWSCTLLYDIGTDSQMPQTVKDKAEKLCWRSATGHPLLGGSLDEDTQITVIPDQDLNALIRNKSSQVLTAPSDQVGDDNLSVIHLYQYSSLTSDFVAKYQWKKNEKNLTIAKSLFNWVTDWYGKHQGYEFINGECHMGIAAVDLFSATSDQKYLQFAQTIFGKINKLALIEKSSLYNKIACSIFADKLDKQSPDAVYPKLSKDLLKDIIINNFDQNAFFSYFAETKLKETKANALMLKLLLND